MKFIQGQTAIEYLLLVTAILVALVVFLAPGGILRNSVDQSLNMTISHVDHIADQVNYSD